MPTRDDSGPAFPTDTLRFSGLTIRDYFAGQALVGILTDPEAVCTVRGDKDPWRAEIAAECYQMADAMLKAREG